jgi:hypothetical protein
LSLPQACSYDDQHDTTRGGKTYAEVDQTYRGVLAAPSGV